jgi:cytochrome P450
MDRANLNHHLGFGTGTHHCIGALLARQEMKCAIREILNNVDSLELAVPTEQLDMSSTMIILRSLTSLPMRLHRKAA